MQITKIETIQLRENRRFLWVHIHTDEGLIGLGETYVHSEPAKALIEELLAPHFLLGKDPLEIEALWRAMFDRCNYAGWAGAEMRAISAIDIALWDILGQYAGQPIYQLLGGKCRDRIQVYNTCGPEEAFNFMENPAEFAQDLLATGVRAMKIWPFDELARASGGHYITLPELNRGLEPIRAIRDAVGDEMDIAIEFHGHWNLPCAVRIAQALEKYEVLWLEDMMQPDNLDAYAKLARATRLPLAVSERLLTRFQFVPVVQRSIVGVINPDVEWCGGISEAKKTATLAEAHQLPIAPHNYGGPILNFASAHVAASTPNLMLLESGRNLLAEWTDEIISTPIVVDGGYMALPEGPGLGTTLAENLLQRDDLIVGTVS